MYQKVGALCYDNYQPISRSLGCFLSSKFLQRFLPGRLVRFDRLSLDSRDQAICVGQLASLIASSNSQLILDRGRMDSRVFPWLNFPSAGKSEREVLCYNSLIKSERAIRSRCAMRIMIMLASPCNPRVSAGHHRDLVTWTGHRLTVTSHRRPPPRPRRIDGRTNENLETLLINCSTSTMRIKRICMMYLTEYSRRNRQVDCGYG